MAMIWIDLSHKSHNAPILYPTMHHFVTETCTCVHVSVTKWCIVGYLSNALWDLWEWSIVGWNWLQYVRCISPFSHIAQTTLLNDSTHWTFDKKGDFVQMHFQIYFYDREFIHSNEVWERVQRMKKKIHIGSGYVPGTITSTDDDRDLRGLSDLTSNIEAQTKWPPFSRRHFQVHFLERKCLNSDYNFNEVCS